MRIWKFRKLAYWHRASHHLVFSLESFGILLLVVFMSARKKKITAIRFAKRISSHPTSQHPKGLLGDQSATAGSVPTYGLSYSYVAGQSNSQSFALASLPGFNLNSSYCYPLGSSLRTDLVTDLGTKLGSDQTFNQEANQETNSETNHEANQNLFPQLGKILGISTMCAFLGAGLALADKSPTDLASVKNTSNLELAQVSAPVAVKDPDLGSAIKNSTNVDAGSGSNNTSEAIVAGGSSAGASTTGSTAPTNSNPPLIPSETSVTGSANLAKLQVTPGYTGEFRATGIFDRYQLVTETNEYNFNDRLPFRLYCTYKASNLQVKALIELYGERQLLCLPHVSFYPSKARFSSSLNYKQSKQGNKRCVYNIAYRDLNGEITFTVQEQSALSQTKEAVVDNISKVKNAILDKLLSKDDKKDDKADKATNPESLNPDSTKPDSTKPDSAKPESAENTTSSESSTTPEKSTSSPQPQTAPATGEKSVTKTSDKASGKANTSKVVDKATDTGTNKLASANSNSSKEANAPQPAKITGIADLAATANNQPVAEKQANAGHGNTNPNPPVELFDENYSCPMFLYYDLESSEVKSAVEAIQAQEESSKKSSADPSSPDKSLPNQSQPALAPKVKPE